MSYWQDMFFALFVCTKLKARPCTSSTLSLKTSPKFLQGLFFFLVFVKTTRCVILFHHRQYPQDNKALLVYLAELSACLHAAAQNSTGGEAEFNARSTTAEHRSSNSGFFLGNTLNEPSCNMQFVNDFKS